MAAVHLTASGRHLVCMLFDVIVIVCVNVIGLQPESKCKQSSMMMVRPTPNDSKITMHIVVFKGSDLRMRIKAAASASAKCEQDSRSRRSFLAFALAFFSFLFSYPLPSSSSSSLLFSELLDGSGLNDSICGRGSCCITSVICHTSRICFCFHRVERSGVEGTTVLYMKLVLSRHMMNYEAGLGGRRQTVLVGWGFGILTRGEGELTCALICRGEALSVVLKSSQPLLLSHSWTPRASPNRAEVRRATVHHQLQGEKKLNMVTQTRVLLHTWVLLNFLVHLSQPVCVDLQSETEAVLGKPMILTCISCMKREEVKAKTRMLKYENGIPEQQDGPFKDRLTWNGSQDLQDVSIQILNVTYDDSGVYECHVLRELEFSFFTHPVSIMKNITLKVIEKASDDPTALYSEIMMYVLLVFLTFWLLVEMVYCYRKISKSDEQAQDTA
ncbi:hypothetical protein INR49_031225 [Caranx melampygus]|nr:hypothetical protein INR49_031225 [Caranx melampygus]